MEYEKYLMRGILVADVEFHVFLLIRPHQREHGIGSYLGGLFKKILPYLNKGAVSKETLRGN